MNNKALCSRGADKPDEDRMSETHGTCPGSWHRLEVTARARCSLQWHVEPTTHVVSSVPAQRGVHDVGLADDGLGPFGH